MFKNSVGNSLYPAEAVTFLGRDDDGKVRKRYLKYTNSLKPHSRYLVECDLQNVCLFAGLAVVLLGAFDILEFMDFPSREKCMQNNLDYDNTKGLTRGQDVAYDQELEQKCETLVKVFPWPITLFFFLSMSAGLFLAAAAILENGYLGLISLVMVGSNFLIYLVQFIVLSLIAPGRDLLIWKVVAEPDTAVTLERTKLTFSFITVSVAYAYAGYFAWSSYKMIKPLQPLFASICQLARSIFDSITCEPEERPKQLTGRADEHEMMKEGRI